MAPELEGLGWHSYTLVESKWAARYLGTWCCGLPLRLSASMFATAQALPQLRQPQPHGLKLDRVMMIASGAPSAYEEPYHASRLTSSHCTMSRAAHPQTLWNHSVPTSSTRYCRQNVSMDQTAHRA